MSWPDLGVALACHGYEVDMSRLQTYFLNVFNNHEVPHREYTKAYSKARQASTRGRL